MHPFSRALLLCILARRVLVAAIACPGTQRSAAIGEFVERHPTVKMLALSFLLLIGTALVADGLDHHIPKGYMYFAMGFSVLVEGLNLRVGRRRALLHGNS